MFEKSIGRYNRVMLPFSMKSLRKLPIVGEYKNDTV